MVENNKIIIFGTGAIAEVANYLRLDSNYTVEGFTVDKKIFE